MSASVRPPCMAGSWYPGRPEALAALLDRLRPGPGETTVHADPDSRVVGLLAPHAGYVYSGATAAAAYAALGAWRPGRVVVLAPSHREAFPGACAWSPAPGRAAPGCWGTPLGEVEVDHDFLARWGSATPLLRFGAEGHRGEHSLELQLPFLQRALGRFRLAPVVLGEQSGSTVNTLALSLAEVLSAEEPPVATLIVASSDLSHFHPLAEARELDGRFLELFSHGDPDKLREALGDGRCEACGGGPAAAMLACCVRLMAEPRVRLLDYRTSAEAGGDASSVVGYGAAVVTESARA